MIKGFENAASVCRCGDKCSCGESCKCGGNSCEGWGGGN